MPVLVGIGGLGVPELLIILVVVLVVFGASRVADIGGSMGKAIREFRKEVRDDEKPSATAPAAPPPGTTAAGTCPNCGTVNTSDAKFCNECGTGLQTRVG